MGQFGKGNVGYSVFYLSGMPDDWQERMKAQGLPGLDTLLEEEIHGWCGWRHVQDRTYTDETLMRGGYPTGLLVKAERKIPSSTLAADIALEELAVMQAEGKTYLNLQIRSEIKQRVRERLLPEMPITFKGTEWVYFPARKLLFSTATSEAQIDTFVHIWLQTMGTAPLLLDAEGRGARYGYTLSDWPAVMFGQQGELFCDGAGREFMMWLWYCSEKRGGVVQVDGHGEFGYMIDGPLEFRSEGKKVVIKSDNALLDAETGVSLEDGLTLGRSSFVLVRGDESWGCTLDADDLVVRSMKMPQTESFGIHEQFAERLVLLSVFEAVIEDLFKCYCMERSDADGWKDVVRAINRWILDRPCRRSVARDRSKGTAEPEESGEQVTISMSGADGKEVMLGSGKTVAEAGKSMSQAVRDGLELIEQAKQVIRETGRASTSSLQRRLRIGYAKASSLMDLLEEEGVIGPPNASGPREVLLPA